MKVEFTVYARPVSLNNAYGTNQYGLRYMTGEGRSYKHACNDALYFATKKMLDKKCPLFTFPINVQLDFYIDNRKRMDVDNLVKLTLDGISGGKILWENDHDIKRVVSEKHYVKNPKDQRIEILIEQMELADCPCLDGYKK